jgi:hypothetical protein
MAKFIGYIIKSFSERCKPKKQGPGVRDQGAVKSNLSPEIPVLKSLKFKVRGKE